MDHYMAYAGMPDSRKSCTVEASAATPECDITGLKAATEYTVEAQACLKGDGGCGQSIEATVTTPPPRKFHAVCFYYDRSLNNAT